MLDDVLYGVSLTVLPTSVVLNLCSRKIVLAKRKTLLLPTCSPKSVISTISFILCHLNDSFFCHVAFICNQRECFYAILLKFILGEFYERQI